MATISKDLTITSEGVYVVELNAVPDGSTVTPVNDIQTWLHCAAIYDKNYTTIGQVIGDGTTFNALVQSANAVNYMVRSTNWASSVAANNTAMIYVGANDNCSKSLLANTTWRSAICNSAYYRNVLTKRVPTMTSNTTPSGTCFASSNNDVAYGAFDGLSAWSQMKWAPNYEVPVWIGYDFGYSVEVARLDFNCGFVSNRGPDFSYTIQGSNDGVNYDPIFTDAIAASSMSINSYTSYTKFIPKNSGYRYWRMYSPNAMHSGNVWIILPDEIRFSGR